MNFKFSTAVAAAFLMLASVANAQSGSQPAAPALGSGARAAAPVISAPIQTIQSVPSVVGSDSRVAAPTIQSVPSGSDSRVAAPVIQSVPSAGGSSSRLAAPVVDTYVAPTSTYSAPVQYSTPAVAPTQSYVPTQSYYPSSGCCQSYSVPSVPTYTPQYRSWGGGWYGRRGCGY